MEKLTKEIHIDGCVEIPIEVSHDEFLTKFINFIEDNNWYFGGETTELTDED